MNREKRLAEILRRKPYLEGYFSVEPVSEYQLKMVSGELPVVVHQNGGAERLLGSGRDPLREAERTLTALPELSGSEIVVVLGLGNPLLLSLILKRLKPNQIVIACDASFAVGARLAQEWPGMLDYLERPGCHLFCGDESLAALDTYLDAIPGERLNGLRPVRQRPSLNLSPEFYRSCEERINSVVQSKLSDLLTRFEFEKKWINNIIINSTHLGSEPGPEKLSFWGGALDGRPGVIVAAGPSLRRSIELVRKLKERAFLLCCDTAYKVLLQNGIEPHGVIALDAQKNTLFHFLGATELSRTVLFADLVINPFVLSQIEPRGVIFSTTAKYLSGVDGVLRREATPGSDFVESFCGSIGDLQSGGSVATTAFELLRFLGAGMIIMVGQDLAYTGREIHATGSHHNESWLNTVSRINSLERINELVVRRRHTFPVAALDGGEVLSDYVLDLYRRWFEDSVGRVELRVVNLTAAGARIAGMERPDDLSAFVETLPILPDQSEIFKKAQATGRYHHQIIAQLYRELRDLLSRLPQAPDEQSLPDALGELSAFTESYPLFKALLRPAEIYIQRNESRLDGLRSGQLLVKNSRAALREIARGLRRYTFPE